jgi:hypothetical protein
MGLAIPGEVAAATVSTRDASVLAAALGDGEGTVVTGASFVAIPPEKNSANYATRPTATGVDDAVSGFPTKGNGYAIISSGDAATVKASDGKEVGSLSGPNVRGNTDFDVTILKVDLTAPAGANCLAFDFRMLSYEYPIYVGKIFNDAFIAELDKSTWTTKDSKITSPDNFAFDPGGKVISVNAAGETSMTKAEAAGTTYSNNGATPLLHAYTTITPGAHSLYLSVFDQGDATIDSTVLIDNVSARNVSGGCASGAAVGAPKPAAPAPTPTPTPTAVPAPVAKPTPTPTPAATGTPPAFGKGGVISLPSTKKCVSRRNFRIRIKEKPNFEIALATVFVDGKRIKTLRQKIFGRPRVTAQVDLRGLPKGTFKVKIVLVATDGRVITGTRKYRTCVPKRRRV